MARKKGRSVGDVTRYTSASSRPPSFQSGSDDDIQLTSGTTFVLIALAAFLLLCFAAVRFGTQAIESDLTARATNELRAAGYEDVTVEASGNTLSLTGTFIGTQSDEEAKAIVSSLSGVGDVEGTIWSADSIEEDTDQRVVGAPLEITWADGAITATGQLSTQEKVDLVAGVLADLPNSDPATITDVDTTGVTVKEGLEDEPWLGPLLALVKSGTERLPAGYVKADWANYYLALSGEILERDVSVSLNDQVTALGVEYGFDSTVPGVLWLKTGPTEEEVEELQEDLNELILDQVVEFEIKSFQLTDKGRALLDEVLAALEMAPEVRVLIAGHTDDRGSDAENQLLSEQRAQAVFDYLVAQGAAADRFDIIGYGESQPRESNATDAGRQANRRIEFVALLDNVIEEDGS